MKCECLWNDDTTMRARSPLCAQHGDSSEFWTGVKERGKTLAEDCAYSPEENEDHGVSTRWG